MELSYFINLIFIFALNALFFISGICLNSLVIITFWKTAQLRKKLCYFMIMVLSCCDFFVVLTNHPLTAVIAMFWLSGKQDEYPSLVRSFSHAAGCSLGVSGYALLVMSFDRYLATYYPLFHRTSVTKIKLLILFGALSVTQVVLSVMSANNSISINLQALIYLITLGPAMVFTNYKLFTIARSSRRNKRLLPEVKKSFSFQNISSCLLTVACYAVLLIPTIIYAGLGMVSKISMQSDKLVLLWAKTAPAVNSTFNCLIFFWKNKILRTEGMKLFKGMKIRRPQSEH